jgi:heme/copper-type cytochrome/quinol oxidase subunit 3
MLLFIVSEVMFFFAFFWAFFHSSLSPAFAIGGTWPPRDIVTISPWGVPQQYNILPDYHCLCCMLAYYIQGPKP